MISTCDLSTVSPRCHSTFLLHLSFLFIRSFSHQPSNGKIIPPAVDLRVHSNNNNHSHTGNDDDGGKKTLSKENGAVVDCYKCMIGGECLLACRVIIIFAFAISRAHTILYCCRMERVVVYCSTEQIDSIHVKIQHATHRVWRTLRRRTAACPPPHTK